METTLEGVQAQFAQWREHKIYARERIPERLWESALSLMSEHSQTTVLKTLGLNRGDFLRRWQERGGKKPHFVEVSGLRNPPPLVSALRCVEVELQRPDGYRLRLISSEGQPMNGQEVIREFLGGSHASTGRSN